MVREGIELISKQMWKRIVRWGTCLVGAVVISIIVADLYFFHVAFVPAKKDFLEKPLPLRPGTALYQQRLWYHDVPKQHWTMESATGHYRLDANYIPARHSDKAVLICHGYMQNKNDMGAYAAMFHQMGYNVLIPDARGMGDSQGKYVGFGWPERYDERKWMKRLVHHLGPHVKIVMFGVSMGGATTMMTSGLHLPKQCVAMIEDCGYTSVKAEITHEAKDMYHMPAIPRWPLIPVLSLMTKLRIGYFMGEASSVRMLHHNHRPMLFIHGAKDTFVPTRMVYQNYRADRGPKELWVCPDADHAHSFRTHPREYERHVQQFLNKYVH